MISNPRTVYSERVMMLQKVLSPKAAAPAPTPLPPQTPPINEDRLVDTFLHLTQIPGPTGNERKVADELKKQLGSLGLTVTEDDAAKKVHGNTGNLLVNIPGNVPGAPTLLFASHMDTVPLAVGCKPIREGDVIRTDGSTALGGDCRAGCSELLEATREILENNLPHGPLQLLFSVGEEGGLLGAYAFDPKQIKAEFAYAVDAFGASEIYTQSHHLLKSAGESRPTAEDIHQAHTHRDKGSVVPPSTLHMTDKEKKIFDFTVTAMQDLGFQPTFHNIEWAASDANALREHGINAISIGAGENNEHTGQEFVRVSDMVKSTALVRQLIKNAAASV